MILPSNCYPPYDIIWLLWWFVSCNLIGLCYPDKYFLNRSHDLVKVRRKFFCQIYYITLVYYPMGHKFSSVLLYLLPFLRYRQLPVFKVIWQREGRVWKILWKLLYNTCKLPYRSQIFVRFALSLTDSEISATSCFQGHMSLWRSGVKNFMKITI